MIIIVGSTKGGVGKSTIAFNFAVALSQARDVVLVDADKQATATINTQIRANERGGEAGFSTIALYSEALIREVPKLAKKYDDIIIDVGGRDNPSLRSALLIPDATILIPVKPRSYELWGAEDTVALVNEARARGNDRLRAVAFLNEADHLHEFDNEAAETDLKGKEGVELAPTRIIRRRAFPDAAAKGKGVVEYRDPKATEELTALLLFVHPQFQKGSTSHGSRPETRKQQQANAIG